jgi:hypothetical protein
MSSPTNPLHRSLHELVFTADPGDINPYLDLRFQVSFIRPDGGVSIADGFYDGNDTFRARAYCDTLGTWEWHSNSTIPELDGKTGTFNIEPSSLPGKLRIHPDDPYQFAYDNGDWFLHIGDTGYRYVTASEPHWKAYIDQAAEMGATKVRTWFCEGRSDVQILLTEDRQGLNLHYWQEIDRRLAYANEKYPHIIFKLIPYGEDTEEIRKYDARDPASLLIGRYAQARFTAYPNVTWCPTNDREIVRDGELDGRKIYWRTINQMAGDIASREPWGTLITNHQCRFKGYDFTECEWSNIVTLEDIDQVHGQILLDYRSKVSTPIINDEDRYETYREPKHPRYFFRRLMWASLLSGGHATYGGLRTFEPYDGDLKGVAGYFDACKEGKLKDGAHDFNLIHQFFKERGLTLDGFTPYDTSVGSNPYAWKCTRKEGHWIVYFANPCGTDPETDSAAESHAEVTVVLPEGSYTVCWFHPSSGEWTDSRIESAGETTFKSPTPGDQVLYLCRD